MPDEPVWPATGGGAVSSVFGRAGDVVGTSTDYRTAGLGGNAAAEVIFGAAGHSVSYGSGAWFGDVAYVRAKDADSLAFDVIPGAAADAWIDIVDRDIVALGITNYESLNIRKYTSGRMTIGSSAAGSGSVSRPLILQPSGGTLGLGLGMTSVAAGAYFEINSTGAGNNLGFLGPRSTTTQKNSIATPPEGLMLYDTTLHKLCVYTGAAWETVTSA